MFNRWIKCTIEISHPMLRCKSIKLTSGIFGGLGVGGFVKSYSSTMGGYKVYTTAPRTSQILKGLPVSASPVCIWCWISRGIGGWDFPGSCSFVQISHQVLHRS